MNLEELKENAEAAGYTNICLDAPGTRPVSLVTWRGMSAGGAQTSYQGLPAVVTAHVSYHAEGNGVRAKRLGEKEVSYVLS